MSIDEEHQWIAARHFHIICGRHSGIPDCCIHFYVNEWLPTKSWNRLEYSRQIGLANELLYIGHAEGMTYKKYILDWNRPAFRYVPCPICLEKLNPITLIRCSC